MHSTIGACATHCESQSDQGVQNEGQSDLGVQNVKLLCRCLQRCLPVLRYFTESALGGLAMRANQIKGFTMRANQARGFRMLLSVDNVSRIGICCQTVYRGCSAVKFLHCTSNLLSTFCPAAPPVKFVVQLEICCQMLQSGSSSCSAVIQMKV